MAEINENMRSKMEDEVSKAIEAITNLEDMTLELEGDLVEDARDDLTEAEIDLADFKDKIPNL